MPVKSKKARELDRKREEVIQQIKDKKELILIKHLEDNYEYLKTLTKEEKIEYATAKAKEIDKGFCELIDKASKEPN